MDLYEAALMSAFLLANREKRGGQPWHYGPRVWKACLGVLIRLSCCLACTAGQWQPSATLTAGDGNLADFFGVSIALSGDAEMLVGAFQRDTNGVMNSGAVYLFGRDFGRDGLEPEQHPDPE